MLLDLMSLVRSGEASQKIDKYVGAADWLSLYRNPRRLKVVLHEIDKVDGRNPGMNWMSRQIVQPQFSPEKSRILFDLAPAKMKKKVLLIYSEVFKQAYRDNLSEIADWIEKGHRGCEMSDEVMGLPETQFFFLVFLPCLLECGMPPGRLLAKARRGDREALLDLVRIDPSAVAQNDVKKLLSDPVLLKNADFWEQYAKVINRGVQYDPDHCRIKAQMASLVIQISQAMGRKLTPKDIRRLYDALQKDLTGNANSEDQDLPETDQAWRTEVGRGKKKWHLDLVRNTKEQIKSSAIFDQLPLVSPEDDTGEMPTWVKQTINPPEPGKLGFWQRISNAWKRFKLEIILEAELRRRKKLMANQPTDSTSTQSKR